MLDASSSTSIGRNSPCKNNSFLGKDHIEIQKFDESNFAFINEFSLVLFDMSVLPSLDESFTSFDVSLRGFNEFWRGFGVLFTRIRESLESICVSFSGIDESFTGFDKSFLGFEDSFLYLYHQSLIIRT